MIHASEDASTKRGRKLSGNSPPKNTKKQKEVDNCLTCNEPAIEDALECVWCEQLQHSKCIKISPSQYSALSNISSNVVFFCSLCLFKLPSALMAYDKTNEACSTIEDKLKSVEINLSKKFNSLADQVKELSSKIRHRSQEPDCEKAMDTRPSQAASTAVERAETTSEVLTSFINEEKERCKRRLNLIVHNVSESSADTGSERKSHDVSTVTSMFEKYLGVKAKITNANRIGQKKDNQPGPRLIKVSVESEREKATILRNCTKLRTKDNPEDIQKVYITPDLTPREQQHNKALRARLAEMNKDGKKYLIKNGRIMQREG